MVAAAAVLLLPLSTASSITSTSVLSSSSARLAIFRSLQSLRFNLKNNLFSFILDPSTFLTHAENREIGAFVGGLATLQNPVHASQQAPPPHWRGEP
jgi:hypothetical protein